LKFLAQVLGDDIEHPAVEGQKNLGFFPEGQKLSVALALDLEAKGEYRLGRLEDCGADENLFVQVRGFLENAL